MKEPSLFINYPDCELEHFEWAAHVSLTKPFLTTLSTYQIECIIGTENRLGKNAHLVETDWLVL